MAYDGHNKQFVLFGGGNVQSERGDPGTWAYSPAKNTWTQLKLELQPPQRANSRLVFDPVNKQVVLFGGDQLDQLMGDTWHFDVVKQTWSVMPPTLSPAPRGGHAMLWLPKAKKVLLLGGYGYTSTTEYVASLYQRLPLELWTYDVAARRWDFLGQSELKTGPDTPANFFTSAAADADDRVLLLGQTGTWQCQIDATKTDEVGRERLGKRSNEVTVRRLSHDQAGMARLQPPRWRDAALPNFKTCRRMSGACSRRPGDR